MSSIKFGGSEQHVLEGDSLQLEASQTEKKKEREDEKQTDRRSQRLSIEIDIRSVVRASGSAEYYGTDLEVLIHKQSRAKLHCRTVGTTRQHHVTTI